VRLVNLTPHPINIIGDGGTKITIQASGVVARVVQEKSESTVDIDIADNITLSVRIQDARNTKIVGLPDPQHDTIYIVSTLVAQIAQRSDVMSPLTDHTAERDDMDNIIGVRGFRRFT
jgi:hypothetical protein